jgi:penicillin-binding protein 1A
VSIPAPLSDPGRPATPPMRRRPAWRRFFRVSSRIGVVLVFGLPVFIGSAAGVGLGALVYGNLQGTIPTEKPGRRLEPSHLYLMRADGTRGEEIHSFRRFELALPMKREDVPQVLKDALVASEDRQFWTHNGIDVFGIARAAYVDVTHGATRQGASTITQQVVREKYLSREQTIERKFNEVLLSTRYERDLTEQVTRETGLQGTEAEKEAKERIIFDYLSTMYFGAGAYGAQAAAETYFHKDVRDLTVAEAATLVGILPSPTEYSPRKNPVLAEDHRRTVLGSMRDINLLTEDEFGVAMKQKLWYSAFGEPPEPSVVFHPAPRNTFSRYPFVVDYVREYLEGKYGAEQLYQGGLQIYASIDPRLQDAAEAVVNDTMRGTQDPLDMALVAVEPATGLIKAMRGGREPDYQSGAQQVNLARGKFPAGSSFKAFTVAAALEKGMPATYGFYAPYAVTKPGCNGGCQVVNAAAGEAGYYDMVTATGMSINTWFVDMIERVGIDRTVDLVHRLGLKPLEDKVYGFNYQMTLGKNEVTPQEMAGGYAVFANRGVKADPVPVAKVVKADGTVLEDNTQPHGIAVMNPIVADWVSEVLRAPIEKGTATGVVKLDRMAAGKTGTYLDHTNAWFVGYVPQLATAVWIGHRNGNQTIVMPGEGPVYGAGPPARTWNAFMNEALRDVPVQNFTPPLPLPKPEELAVPLPGERLVLDESRSPAPRGPSPREIPQDCGGPCVVTPSPTAPAPAPRPPAPLFTLPPPASAPATTASSNPRSTTSSSAAPGRGSP